MASSSSSSSDRANKLRRLSTCSALLQASTTKTAISQLLMTLQNRGHLNSTFTCASESEIKHDLQKALLLHSSTITPYGPVVQKMHLCDDVPTWSYVHPCALMHHLSGICPSFGDLMSSLIEPEFKPLRVVLYMDEIVPGNPLRIDKARSIMCVYYSFVEFPQHVLQRGNGWFLFGILRSKLIELLPGGESQLFKMILRNMFATNNCLAVGVNIVARDRLVTCRAIFGGLLADEVAHKDCFNIKGAAGTKPCISCKNVVNHNVMVGDSDYLVSLLNCDCSRLDRHTNASIYEAVDLLRRSKATMSKTKFKDLETLVGINFCEHSVLFDDELRYMLKPVDHNIRDWMHTMLSSGVASIELSLVLQELKNNGIAMSSVTKYSFAFTLPKSRGRVSPEWFSDKRIMTDHLKTTSASENINIIRVLNAFLEDIVIPLDVARAHCKCFSMLAQIVDVMMLGPEGAADVHAQLQSLIVAHNKLFVELYADHVKPKLHHMLHIPDNIAFLGKLLSCFVTERKHRIVKARANHTYRHMEHTVTLDLVNAFAEEANSCKELYRHSFLIRPHKCGDNFMESGQATLPCGTVSVGDIVCFESSTDLLVGSADGFYGFEDMIFVRVRLYKSNLSPRVFTTSQPQLSFVDASTVTDVLSWAPYSDDSIRIIKPFRGF
jgi:hypothetical protein